MPHLPPQLTKARNAWRAAVLLATLKPSEEHMRNLRTAERQYVQLYRERMAEMAMKRNVNRVFTRKWRLRDKRQKAA